MKRRAKLLGHQTEAAATPTKKARTEMPPPPAPQAAVAKSEETKQVVTTMPNVATASATTVVNAQAIVSVLEALPSSSYLLQ